MLLTKIKLENIRSYCNQDIIFPAGSIMLSGDIGSGKSTVLLAAEFALFGITKELPGGLLLRNGEQTGSVELSFVVQEKEVLIKRNLKRSSSSVVQDAGYVIVNGEKFDLTAVELKQKILDLLAYPADLLKKSKSMLYRYTVYTPQETMKDILLGNKESRLEILRRVFGIDKYKRIRDNATIVVSEVKQKAKELAIVSADFFEKEKEKEEYSHKKVTNEEILQSIRPKLLFVQEKVKKQKADIELLEKKRLSFEAKKKEVEALVILLEHKTTQKKHDSEKVTRLVQECSMLREDVKEGPENVDTISELLKKNEQMIVEYEGMVLAYERKVASFDEQRSNQQKICEDIQRLATCPVCKQVVNEAHKNAVITEAEKQVALAEQEKGLIIGKRDAGQVQLNQKKEEIKKLHEQKSKMNVIVFKKEEVRKKDEEVKNIQEKLKQQEEEIVREQEKKRVLESELKGMENVGDLVQKQKEALQKDEEERMTIDRQIVAVETELKSIEINLGRLNEEVRKKQEARDHIVKLKDLQEWLEKQFMNVVLVMEKKIMLRVHHELESLLQKWFGMLVDAETIKVRLDEEFTPLIEQNGHEIEYSFLSGGEKTAAALSYRLALNQVINSLMTTIKTRDLLILDEPTDGFSNEQLDRMRNILEELNTKQTILVSHDHKIESFVDTVIRVTKSEHMTHVVQ